MSTAGDTAAGAWAAAEAIAATILTSADQAPTGSTLFRASLTAPNDATAYFDLGFDLLEWPLVRWEDIGRREVRYEAYFLMQADAHAFERLLRAQVAIWELSCPWSICVDEIQNADWRERWKAYFDIIHVSERVVIQPAWLPYEPKARECVITLEPGMSFGTGQHFTTLSCLKLLDRLSNPVAPGSMLDVGCGSGILSIGAALLGYRPVVALDNDPQCIITTQENADKNDVATSLSVNLIDGRELGILDRFDVVVANILAHVLIGLCDQITRCVGAGEEARLILAGILRTQQASVEAAYHAAGFKTVDVLSDSEWSTLLLSRT